MSSWKSSDDEWVWKANGCLFQKGLELLSKSFRHTSPSQATFRQHWLSHWFLNTDKWKILRQAQDGETCRIACSSLQQKRPWTARKVLQNQVRKNMCFVLLLSMAYGYFRASASAWLEGNPTYTTASQPKVWYRVPFRLPLSENMVPPNHPKSQGLSWSIIMFPHWDCKTGVFLHTPILRPPQILHGTKVVVQAFPLLDLHREWIPTAGRSDLQKLRPLHLQVPAKPPATAKNLLKWDGPKNRGPPNLMVEKRTLSKVFFRARNRWTNNSTDPHLQERMDSPPRKSLPVTADHRGWESAFLPRSSRS